MFSLFLLMKFPHKISPNQLPTAPQSILTPRPPHPRSEHGRRRQLADLQALRRVLRVDLLPEGHRSPWHRMGRTLQRCGNQFGHDGTYIVNYIHGNISET